MVHHRDGLSFRFESRYQSLGRQVASNHLECNPTFDRVLLLRQPYGAHAAFADLLQQLIRANGLSAHSRFCVACDRFKNKVLAS